MIENKELTRVFRKMCELAGVDYDSIDFTEDGWHSKHTWTDAKQEEFRKWLYKHMLKPSVTQALYGNSLTTASVREQRTLWFITSYGWRVKEVGDGR